MKAPVGSIVRIFVDLRERVRPDDIIETQTGRRYRVLAVREQQRGKHVGRQHLTCIVLDGEVQNVAVTTDKAGNLVAPRLHRIRWYPRKARKR